jgi:hypothetical protein
LQKWLIHFMPGFHQHRQNIVKNDPGGWVAVSNGQEKVGA